jgi:hypothetical protein
MSRLGTPAFVALGIVLLGLGVGRDSWWTIVGGLGSLAAAAWRATEETPP